MNIYAVLCVVARGLAITDLSGWISEWHIPVQIWVYVQSKSAIFINLNVQLLAHNSLVVVFPRSGTLMRRQYRHDRFPRPRPEMDPQEKKRPVSECHLR